MKEPEEKKLTVEDLEKVLRKGAENARELNKQLKNQFGMSNINHSIRFK